MLANQIPWHQIHHRLYDIAVVTYNFYPYHVTTKWIFSTKLYFTWFKYIFWQRIFNKFLDHITLSITYFYLVLTEFVTHMNIKHGVVITWSFFQCPNKWYPISRLLWLAMGCILWFKSLFLFCSSHCNDICNIMSYWTTLYGTRLYSPSHKFLCG